jgi:hypothetical protein
VANATATMNAYTYRCVVSGTCSPSATSDGSATFTVYAPPTANAGTVLTVCSNAGGTNITTGSSATNYSAVAWSSSGTGSFTNANSLTTCTYSPSVADITAGSVTLTLTVTGNSPCGIATSNKTHTIKLDGSWNGSIGTDWNNPGNWDCNLLPTLTTNVLIANSKPNYPNNSTGTADQAKDLTIQGSASVTVTGNTLEIAGAISNSGTFTVSAGTIEMKGSLAQTIPSGTFSGNTIMNLNINNSAGVTLGGPLNLTGILQPTLGTFNSAGNLTLVSTGSQTALISGSGSGQVTGIVNMQRYLASGFGYKYFASPFSDATVAQFSGYLSGTATIPTFFAYDENHTNAGNDMTGWTAYTAGGLSPMSGYAANLGAGVAPVTISLNGTVNNGVYSTPLFNHNRTYTKGFSLVGNPYPSPIDWDASGWTKTNIDNAIYFFDASGGADQYSGSYSSYVNGVSGGSTNLIPSMQAFFVHVTDGSYPVSGTLEMTNNIRTTDLNPSFKSAVADPRTILRFASVFDGNAGKPDPFVIYFDPSTTNKFDKESDALKLMNTDDQVTNLYAFTADNRQVAINGMPLPVDSLTTIPLGLTIFKDGWVTIQAKKIEQLPQELGLYLLDNVTKVNQDLKKYPNYRFYLKQGTYNQRFSIQLRIEEKSVTTPLSERLFALNKYNGALQVKINLPNDDDGKLYLTDMMGRIILQKEVSNLQTIDLGKGLNDGVYVVTVTAGKRKQSEKTIIRK